MIGACSISGKVEKYRRMKLGNLNIRKHVLDLVIDVRIIINRIL